MNAEQKKAHVRRTCDEIWCKGNVAVAPELFTEDYENHGSLSLATGLAAGLGAEAAMRTALYAVRIAIVRTRAAAVVAVEEGVAQSR